MMLSESMRTALNEQIDKEIYSSHLYMSMALDFAASGFNGFAHWLQIQSDEERYHARKICHHILSRGSKVNLNSIEKPPTDWKSVSEAIKSAQEHEEKITGSIHQRLQLARDENDYASEKLLMWFVEEQVEEEAKIEKILTDLKHVGTSMNGILFIDKELHKRHNVNCPANY